MTSMKLLNLLTGVKFRSWSSDAETYQCIELRRGTFIFKCCTHLGYKIYEQSIYELVKNNRLTTALNDLSKHDIPDHLLKELIRQIKEAKKKVYKESKIYQWRKKRIEKLTK